MKTHLIPMQLFVRELRSLIQNEKKSAIQYVSWSIAQYFNLVVVIVVA